MMFSLSVGDTGVSEKGLSSLLQNTPFSEIRTSQFSDKPQTGTPNESNLIQRSIFSKRRLPC